MKNRDLAVLAGGLAPVIQRYVGESLAGFERRLEAIEKRAPEPGPRGERGERGEPGQSGKDGVGVFDAVQDHKGCLILTLSDGRTKEVGLIRGRDGERGPQGEAGAAGEPGAQGEKGDPGERGEQGKDGMSGPQGEPGPRGEKGDPGERGERGEPGAPGAQGEPGRDGADGRDGVDGKDGRDGIDGKDGAAMDSLLTVPDDVAWSVAKSIRMLAETPDRTSPVPTEREQPVITLNLQTSGSDKPRRKTIALRKDADGRVIGADVDEELSEGAA